MARLKLPARSADVAASLGMTIEQAAAMRDELIKKGMAYSPKRGLIDFTVPLFDAFMLRQNGTPAKAKRGKSKPKTMFD